MGRMGAGAGGETITTAAITVIADTLSKTWNHGLNSTKAWAAPIGDPRVEWHFVIDDANNITVHIAMKQFGRSVLFRGYVAA